MEQAAGCLLGDVGVSAQGRVTAGGSSVPPSWAAETGVTAKASRLWQGLPSKLQRAQPAL